MILVNKTKVVKKINPRNIHMKNLHCSTLYIIRFRIYFGKGKSSLNYKESTVYR